MYEKIPQELKAMDQWVCWRLMDDPGKDRKRKVPIDPKTGEPAKSNDPGTWSSFEAACRAKEQYQTDGIGIMFANNIFGIDLDHCFDEETGEMVAYAKEILDAVQSYSEISPSGTGIHILCSGQLPEGRRRRGNIEMYSSGRFFTVTGAQIGGEYIFSDCTERVKEMHAKYLGSEEKPAAALPAPAAREPGLSIDDILKRAFDSKGGDKVRDFYEGRWERHGIGDGSQSSADQAFCNLLAFWCRRDEQLMDAIFRQSGMMRKKWDQRRGGLTYGQKTIQTAIRDCKEVWEQTKKRQQTSRPPAPPPSPPINKPETPAVPAAETNPEDSAAKPLYYSFDDTGNAHRFRDTHLGDIRFNHIDKAWLYWDGRRWAEDETGEIKRKADVMLVQMEKELTQNPHREDAGALRKHITRSRSSRGKNAFIEECKHLDGVPILPADLDKAGNAFNVKNCVVSLKTGNTRPHDRSFLLSKLADVTFDANAKCPRWEKFLKDITNNNEELILYLQRMVGYCPTASTQEQCVFFLYGNGSNGKSTFVDTMAAIMGEYAAACQPETVMMRDKNNGARADIARLRGARLVTTYEPNEGSRLDEGIVKQLTGGDKVTARFLYGKEFEFNPEFKILMATNYKPNIKGMDQGIWRRIRLIPFTVEIPKEKQDRTLPDKLRRECSGILNWAIAGAVGWYREGLPACAAVDGATREYRSEMDRIQQFEDDCLTKSSSATTQASMLYQCYKSWCLEQGDRYPIGSVKFYGEFKKRYESRKTAAFNEYLGITFNDHGYAILDGIDRRKGGDNKPV